MAAFDCCDLRDANVYKMMEELGIEAGGGVVPRFGLTYASAIRRCQTCRSVQVCSQWLGAHTSTSLAPGFCPNADIFFELTFDGQTSRSPSTH
jgi:Family of unknown function (DUF6455)